MEGVQHQEETEVEQEVGNAGTTRTAEEEVEEVMVEVEAMVVAGMIVHLLEVVGVEIGVVIGCAQARVVEI
jgi:hypothetical protein